MQFYRKPIQISVPISPHFDLPAQCLLLQWLCDLCWTIGDCWACCEDIESAMSSYVHSVFYVSDIVVTAIAKIFQCGCYYLIPWWLQGFCILENTMVLYVKHTTLSPSLPGGHFGYCEIHILEYYFVLGDFCFEGFLYVLTVWISIDEFNLASIYGLNNGCDSHPMEYVCLSSDVVCILSCLSCFFAELYKYPHLSVCLEIIQCGLYVQPENSLLYLWMYLV